MEGWRGGRVEGWRGGGAEVGQAVPSASTHPPTPCIYGVFFKFFVFDSTPSRGRPA